MDLTTVVVGGIALLSAVLTVTLVPWLKGKVSEQELRELLKWVEIAVMAAQQLYHQLDGAKRKAYVFRFLTEKGYQVDTQEVDSAIEAAVLKLHQQLEAA